MESGNHEKSEVKSKNKKGTWSEGFCSLIIAVLIALAIRWALVEAYVIPSPSMVPSLLIHDHIFVNKLVYGIRVPFMKTWLMQFSRPKNGEVIVFKYPEDESTFFIKRIVAIGGDKVHYEDGNLEINGKPIEKVYGGNDVNTKWVADVDSRGGTKEEYDQFTEALGEHHHDIYLHKNYPHMDAGPLTVPEGYLFVMGDNRDNSNDSRYWGFVPQENILGRAMFVWLSCEETFSALPFLCNPLTLRWSRFFHSIH